MQRRPISDQALEAWTDYLIYYAENWDHHFKCDDLKFFTQEYWYLFVKVTRAYWNGNPLNVSGARTAIAGLFVKFDEGKSDRIAKGVKAGILILSPFLKPLGLSHMS